MGIVLKHTMKNIIKKPFRSLMVMFCIFICTVAAMLCFDMTNSIEAMLTGVYSSTFGNVDILVNGTDISLDFLEEENLPDMEILPISYKTNYFYRDIEGEYTYVTYNGVGIYGVDLEKAELFNAIPGNIRLADNEVALSKRFAEQYGYAEGDIIILHDINNRELEYIIKNVVDSKNKGFLAGFAMVVSEEGFKKLYDDNQSHYVYVELKINDKTSAYETAKYLNENYPEYSFDATRDNPEVKKMVDTLSKFFFVLFALCFLMVLFVTISVSERIVCERMSVVGTLRSIGLSPALTAGILLLENGIYGIVGSGIGCLVYMAIRLIIFNAMFGVALGGNLDFGQVKIWLVIVVMLCAVLVECLCPIKEIIKAVKTPIRDIIFANKDTAYSFNGLATVAGILLMVAGVVCLFVPNNFVTSIASLLCMAMGLALLFPYALRAVGYLFQCIFEKLNKPIARMAAIECYSKKSTVGGMVLIATAVAVAIVVYTVAGSMRAEYQHSRYTSEVIVETTESRAATMFSYIQHLDEVSDVEMLYHKLDTIKINGENDNTVTYTVYPYVDGGYKYFDVLSEYPEPINEEEIVIGENMAKKKAIKKGDILTVEFLCDYYMPVTREFIVKDIVNTSYIDSFGYQLIINSQLYTNIYGDKPSEILVKTSDPLKTDAEIEKYSSMFINDCYTAEEYKAKSESDNFMIIAAINFVIVMGVGLTFIGAVSNLIIGFEGRKRECAVLLSTAMGKDKLSFMFFLESFIATGIAILVAVPMGLIMINSVTRALSAISYDLMIEINLLSYILFIVGLWIVFSLTALLPMNLLKKMKIAEQLKYE